MCRKPGVSNPRMRTTQQERFFKKVSDSDDWDGSFCIPRNEQVRRPLVSDKLTLFKDGADMERSIGRIALRPSHWPQALWSACKRIVESYTVRPIIFEAPALSLL